MRQGMKILITAGGTKIPLDDVRYLQLFDVPPVLSNFATGSFGAKLAKAFFLQGKGKADDITTLDDLDNVTLDDCIADPVYHLRATDAVAIDPSTMSHHYHPVTFYDYAEYSSKLEALCKEHQFDVVFLAAAVSDYGLPSTPGKISSDQDEITITLKRIPKLITKIKEWNPNCVQVGFKLLSNVSEEKLIETAIESGIKANSDFTIANDLNSIKNKSHVIYLVNNYHETWIKYNVDTQEQVNDFIEAFLKIIQFYFIVRPLIRCKNDVN